MKYFQAYKLFLDAKDIGIYTYPEVSLEIIKYLILKLGYQKESDIDLVSELDEDYIIMYGNLVKGEYNQYPAIKLDEDEKYIAIKLDEDEKYINLDVVIYIVEELQHKKYTFREIEQIIIDKIQIVDTLTLATKRNK